MPTLSLGSGPTLLFLHGVGMRAAAYRPLLESLGRRFHVLAPDLPGAGTASLAPGELSLQTFADSVQRELDRHGTRPAVIVGHSLGGGVALTLAGGKHPDASLVLIDSVGTGTRSSDAALLARFFLLKNLRTLLSPRRWPALWRVFPHFLATTAFRIGKTLRLGALALRAARERHPALGARTRGVFIAATEDELFPAQLYRDCAAGLPSMRVIEVAGGHDWCLLCPAEASRVILGALGAEWESRLTRPPGVDRIRGVRRVWGRHSDAELGEIPQ